MSKVIAHIDLNTFFVRCEELKDPSIIGKPVIIGHTGRGGIVSTCSYEARSFGVKSGMPTYMALKLCPKAIVIYGDYSFYKKKSDEFFNFIIKYSPIIEKASIDECYIDFTNQLKNVDDPKAYFKNIQNHLLNETGLKCSIGIAPTKFLSKMASDMKKPMGLTIIRRKDVRNMLDPLPIESFFGIGKKTSPKLREKGINTIGDLAILINKDDESVKNELGKFFYIVKDWINGYGSDVVDTSEFDPKSIGHSTTLYEDTNSREIIKDNFLKIASYVSNDAKKRKKVGSSIQIVLKDTEFRTINRSKRISNPSNDEKVIYNTACELLDLNYDNRMIRLVGITLQNLKDYNEVSKQLSIFDNFDEIEEQCSTQLLIAELNRKMNKPVFKTAREHLKEINDGTK